MRSNCLIFAVGRLWKRGGYLVIRRSRFLWLPHFLWVPPGGLDGVTVEHFVPINPTRRPWAVWRAAVFDGRIRRCDRITCLRVCCVARERRKREGSKDGAAGSDRALAKPGSEGDGGAGGGRQGAAEGAGGVADGAGDP